MKKIFVITPIGKKGSEEYKKYDAIFNSMIKPAVNEVDDFEIIKANDIYKPGSFVKNILENLYSSDIVIANLTGLNPNVFYELGVRHALSNRTILITEDLMSIPSDLREYRAIEYKYDISEIEIFKEDLSKTILEVLENPDHPDNPVQDRLQNIINNREESYKKEIEILIKKLDILGKSETKSNKQRVKLTKESLFMRLDRILELKKLKRHILRFKWNEKDETYQISNTPTDFNLYTPLNEKEIIIISKLYYDDLNSILADIRIMLTRYQETGKMKIKFVIATDEEDIGKNKEYIYKYFKNAKDKADIEESDKKFELEIWDDQKLTEFEKELGIYL